MPKRISKRYSRHNLDFYSGFSIGKTLMRLSVEFHLFRMRKQQTIEQFASNCGVNPKFIKGIEDCNIYTFMNADLGDFTKVALYCDVALAVKFTGIKETLKDKFSGLPATWEEEFGSVEVGSTKGNENAG